MDVQGEGQFVGGMPIINSEGTLIEATIRQTLPALTQMATAIVTSPVRRGEFIDEGKIVWLYGWRKDRPAVGWGRTPAEARESLLLDLIDGLES